jgi:tetratricopeptide (TPR) repeat protein
LSVTNSKQPHASHLIEKESTTIPHLNNQQKANRRRGSALAQEAYHLHDTGQLQSALALLKQAWNLGYQQAEVLREHAKILCELHREREALSVIEHAIKADPRHPPGYSLKGVVLFRLGEHDSAVAQHELAIQHAPAELLAEFYVQKSGLLWQVKRFEEALLASEEAITRDPTNSHAFAAKGHSLAAMERNEEALETYRQALALNPQNATVYAGMQIVLQKLGRVQEAAQIKQALDALN